MKMRRRSMKRTPSDAIIATRSVLFHAWCVFFFSISRCARAQPASTSETSTQLPERSGLVGVEKGPRRTEYADGVFNVRTGTRNGRELQINSHRVITNAKYEFWQDVECRETLYVGNGNDKVEVRNRLETIFANVESLAQEFVAENAVLRAENAELRSAYNALYAKVDGFFQSPSPPPPPSKLIEKHDHCLSAVNSRKAKSSFTGITCDGATSMISSSNDPTECFQTCSECDECASFNYEISTGECTWASSAGWNDGQTNSDFEWYRPCSGISDSNFATHVAGCLAEAPVDGLCKEYSGKNFAGSVANYIGMMPYWDVSSVTNMTGAFENQVSFNGDISSWDVSSVASMERMFSGAANFARDISSWSVDSASSTTDMFLGATGFQAKYTCTSADDGPSNSCKLRRSGYCMSAWYGKKASSTYAGITCNGATSMMSSLNPTECFQTCSECDNCKSFNYEISTGECTWASSVGWSSGTSDSNFEWYRPCIGISDSNFATHVAGCLAEAPVDGLCKKYGGQDFAGYGTNYIGMMPYWDVSSVTDMTGAFENKVSFNGDISGWDTSKVTNMTHTFYEAQEFNQPIGSWDVSQVKNMDFMFFRCYEFIQSLNDWDVSSVTSLEGTFLLANKFNRPLDKWDTSNVENIYRIFSDNAAFDQPIGNWNTSKVKNMGDAFGTGSIFNQDISTWDTSSVTSMYKMFFNNVYFDQDIRGWNTSQVTDMGSIIDGATAFNAKFQCTSDVNGPLSSCVCVLCSCASSSGKMDSNRYCNAAIDGGGWTLAYTVNPNDGHKMGFGAVFWTQSDSSESVSDNVLLRDYVSSAGNSMAAKEIMISIDYSPSDGSYAAYTIWPFRDTTKSLLDYLRSPSANCYTGQGATYEYSKREVVTSVPYDPITNQGGELYINFHYGNNALRFMPSLQCKYSNNGLSCINDDMMTGIGGDFTGMSQSNVYPSFLSGSWDHDALIHGCGSGGQNPQGTDYGTSQTSDGTYYRYSVWVR